MTKLDLIKAKLAKILLGCASIKTDKAILEYDGEELKVDIEVYVLDENGERTKPEDGSYITEDEKTIVVVNGVVVEIQKKEEPTTEEEEIKAEETTEETTTEEPTTEEETTEVDVTEELKNELDAMKVVVEELKNNIEQLAELIKELAEKNDTDTSTMDERLSKIEKMSASNPIEKEIENVKTSKKTGDSKVDKFLEKFC